MDVRKIKSIIEDVAPGGILNTGTWGRGDVAVLWVEMAAIERIGKKISRHPELMLDWLENLSAMQMSSGQKGELPIVLTYFVRSMDKEGAVILRGTLVPGGRDTEVSVPSVTSVWPMAALMERETGDLFGIRFKGAVGPDLEIPQKRSLLPEKWTGFPLRKSYVFPAEVMGIYHHKGKEVIGRG